MPHIKKPKKPIQRTAKKKKPTVKKTIKGKRPSFLEKLERAGRKRKK